MKEGYDTADDEAHQQEVGGRQDLKSVVDDGGDDAGYDPGAHDHADAHQDQDDQDGLPAAGEDDLLHLLHREKPMHRAMTAMATSTRANTVTVESSQHCQAHGHDGHHDEQGEEGQGEPHLAFLSFFFAHASFPPYICLPDSRSFMVSGLILPSLVIPADRFSGSLFGFGSP